MAKTRPQPPSEAARLPAAAPLSPVVRRHLGQNLRSLYADALTAPVSQRLEALIAQLERSKP